MTTVFFIPLVVVALVESQLDVRASLIIRNLYDHVDEGEEEDPKNQDPETDHEDGMEISRVPFSDLVKEFPNSYQVRFGSLPDHTWQRLIKVVATVVDGVLHSSRDRRYETTNYGTVGEVGQEVI